MDSLLQDVRYGLRMLAKRPGFTAVAVLSLALGIGANTTIFTLINAVYLRPVPVEDPSSLVYVFTSDENQDTAFGNLMPMSWPNYRDYRDQADVFEGLALTDFGNGVAYTGQDEPKILQAQLVTGNYFDVLGIDAAVGRTFGPTENEVPGRDPVVVLSHSLWEREFGADPDVVGRVLTLNGYGFTVVGVAPEGFKGLQSVGNPDLMWIPLMMYEQIMPPFLRPEIANEERRPLLFRVFGRLKDGVTVERAQAALSTVADRLERQYPIANEGRGARVTPYTPVNPNQAQQFTLAGSVLMAIVGLVLLIACANVANLLLARASSREREIGVRLALGADRRRLVRQLLTESVLLGLAGGVVGLLVAVWGRSLLWNFRPPFLDEGSVSLDFDPTVLGFTAAIALGTGLVFGLIPALQSTKQELTETLHEGGRGGGSGARQHRIRSGLVVAEIALALVALVGAGLFIRSMQAAQEIDPGFDTERLALMNVNPITAGYAPAEAQRLYDRIRERASAIGSVHSVSLGGGPPPAVVFMRTTFPENLPRDHERSGILTLTSVVTPGYFETVGIPLVRGRALTDFDNQDGPAVAVINRAAVQRFWPEEDPLGERFSFMGEERPIQVVGVVEDSLFLIGQPARPIIFMPVKQRFQAQMTVTVRSEGDPEAVIADVQNVIREIDPKLAVTGVTTMGQIIDQQLWGSRMGAALLGIFGILALILASVGIYGVMAYSVNQRSHEIGIRIALGAGQGEVLRMVLRQGMTLAAMGVGIGLVLALLVSRSMQDLLYDISATDPVTFVAIPAILLLVALVANLIPARRVLRVDPVIALKNE